MAGIYGWNIDATQDLLKNEGEFVNTTESSQSPSQSENEDDRDDADDIEADTHDDNEISSEKLEQCSPLIMGYYWCITNGEIPSQAVKSGIDKDGGDIYIGRAIHEGELLPAKIVPNHGCAYVSFNGEEIMKLDYEILCRGTCTVIWQACRGGAVPDNAVIGGCTSDNEKLYIGRVIHCGTQTPGKVHPSQNACFIPYAGEELSFENYEVLVLQ